MPGLGAIQVWATAWLLLAQTASGAVLSEADFELRGGLIWLKVSVPRSVTPLNFILDSGASASVLDAETAKRLKLILGHQVSVAGIGKKTIGYWPVALTLSVAGTSLPQSWLVTNLKELSKVCLCHVDGLIGADFFANKRLQIDYHAKKLRVLADCATNGQALTLPIEWRKGIPFVSFEVNGVPGRFRLDMGCTSALEWVTNRGVHAKSMEKISIGLAEIPSQTALVTITLGDENFPHVEAGIHPQALFPGEAGLLGNAFLSRYCLTVDSPRGVLYLSRNSE